MAESGSEKTENNQTSADIESESELSEKERYFKALRLWHDSYRQHELARCAFPYYLMANPQLYQTPSGTSQRNNAQVNQRQGRIFNYFDSTRQARQDEIIRLNGGYEYTIAPLWKRVVAEIIDIFILFLFKLMIAFALVDIFDYNLSIDLDFTNIRNSLEDDYTELLNFTSEFIVLEIITKIATCFYEALWTANTNNVNRLGGATPGKMLMGIRILHVEAVQMLEAARVPAPNNNQPLKALMWPAQNLGFERAMFRSFAKNMFITFLFPLCFITFLDRNNRTIYDVMTKTVVVEEQVSPPLRRRQ